MGSGKKDGGVFKSLLAALSIPAMLQVLSTHSWAGDGAALSMNVGTIGGFLTIGAVIVAILFVVRKVLNHLENKS